jgi:DNA-binding response OmpR family regulator
MTIARKLDGQRIVVVEDEPLIALDLEAILVAAGAEVIGIGRTVPQALELIETGAPTAAIVDLRLNSHSARDVARRLSERGIPFIFYSGLEDAPTAASWPNAPLISKPATEEQIVAALVGVLRKSRRRK